ncbi:MAG: polyketide synthase Pks13 [Corynebacterium sp.]|nr:polyketide synthase Pks13 [Corynebacterium sp.]
MVNSGSEQLSPATKHNLSVSELREWLRQWVHSATNISLPEITDDTPLVSLGLSSRDVVVLSGELERLLGLNLDPTIAYEYPTIGALSSRLINGVQANMHAKTSTVSTITPTDIADPANHDIAIIGMSGRFPGGEDLDALWQLYVLGESGVGQLPEGRWSEYSSDPIMVQRMAEYNTTGGYLSDISQFDAEAFGISPVEATNMDPQQRIMLELAWEALQSAHIPANSLRGSATGVFVGSSNNDYGLLVASDPQEAHPYALTGTASAVIPNRISYSLDLRGPSVQVDTACSSSIVSLHQAVRALRGGECDLALAGGVNILAVPFASTAFGELGVISPSGGIHAFSDNADGIVRSDGAGFVVLKRVKDAIADGDHILAVVKGSAVNNDGRSNGLTAPNPDAQVDVLRRAYQDAGVDPRTVDLIEAHGTGTILGDPIEAQALGEVLGAGRDVASPLLLGSAKSNIGHSESAAGIAGLIKLILSMQNDTIPPMAGFTGPNPYIDFSNNNLEVVEDPREWPEYSGHKIAGVSGFGFGGTNAHAVISEFVADEYTAGAAGHVEGAGTASSKEAQLDSEAVLLPVSALLPSRRKANAKLIAEFIAERSDADLPAIARSLGRQNHGRSRAMVTAHNIEEAVKRLGLVAEGKKSIGIDVADSPATEGPVFVYSGFGSQHRKMAKEFYQTSEFFQNRINELDELIKFESGWSLVELILDDEQTYDTETAQVAITAIQIALTDFLAEAGIKPAAVAAMSMGEIAAAYAVGGLSAEDTMRIASHRSRLMGEGEKSLPEDQLGAMAVVEFSVDELDRFIADNPEYGDIEPAVYGGPGMTTVGGPREQVTKLVEKLEGEGKLARLLNVKGAGHTSAVEPLLGELEGEICDIEARPIHTPLYSSVHRGVVYNPGSTVHDPQYWIDCTRGRVWFQDAITTAFGAGFDTFVEISPNPVAIMPMMNTAFAIERPDARLLFALKRKVGASESIRDLVSKLYVTGANVDFRFLEGDGELLFTPSTQWNHQRYWTAARPSSGGAVALPGRRITLPNNTICFNSTADTIPSIYALVESAAEAMNPGAAVTALEEHSQLPASGEVNTLCTTHIGGINIAVYKAGADDSAILVAEAFASTNASVDFDMTFGNDIKAADDSPATFAEDSTDIGTAPWDPNSGETVEDRLRAIVSESMGYEIEDLPAELPLIDLGLDSLMGMRIKNRIEHDFQIPPLNVQAIRDASVADVVTLVEDMVANPEAYRQEGDEEANGEDAAGTNANAESEASSVEAAPAAADAEENSATDNASEDDSVIVAVAPRDAAERMVFAAWASIVGSAMPGMTHPIPEISNEKAVELAERLTERAGIAVTVEQIREAHALEDLADIAREGLETEVEGNIRVLRARPEGSTKPAVFMFHPAGGSSVVYQPLARRLPEDVPVYGVERLEGSLEERCMAYLPEIEKYSDGLPIILGGWSFGGALAYETAHLIEKTGANIKVAHIALLDTTQPSEKVPDTLEETKARWERYAAFGKKTYGFDFPVPYDLLETAGEEALLTMMTEFLSSPEAAAGGVAAGVLEHQRASFVDNRILDKIKFEDWADVDIPVTLFRSERMHDGAIELEPRYAHIDPDGGWGVIVKDLDIVQLHGDHLAVVDEPEIATVGASLTKTIEKLSSEAS